MIRKIFTAVILTFLLISTTCVHASSYACYINDAKSPSYTYPVNGSSTSYCLVPVNGTMDGYNVYFTGNFQKNGVYEFTWAYNHGSGIYNTSDKPYFPSAFTPKAIVNQSTTYLSVSNFRCTMDYASYNGICSIQVSLCEEKDVNQINVLFYEEPYIFLNKYTASQGFRVFNDSYNLVKTNTSCHSNDGSNSTIINQNNQLIDQNNQIIQGNQNINNSINEAKEQEKKNHEEAEETRKGILQTIIDLPGKLLDMLIGVFVPDNFDFLDNFKDSLSKKLGFIAEIPIKFFDFLSSLASADWEEFTSVSFPSISIFGYYFWDSSTIDLSTGINIFKPFKYVTDVICVLICCRYLIKLYHKFFGDDAT